MGLESKLGGLKRNIRQVLPTGTTLESLGVKKPKKKLFKSSNASNYLAFELTGVEDDIKVGGDLERVFRDVVGYGSFNKDYNPQNRVLIGTYSPIGQEFYFAQSSSRKNAPVRVSGIN